MKITIPDPAMSCSTGICGPDVDYSLVQTATDVKYLKSLGLEVALYQKDLKRSGMGIYARVINQKSFNTARSERSVPKEQRPYRSGVIKKLMNPLPGYGFPNLPQESLLQALLEFYNSRQVFTTKYTNGSYKK